MSSQLIADAKQIQRRWQRMFPDKPPLADAQVDAWLRLYGTLTVEERQLHWIYRDVRTRGEWFTGINIGEFKRNLDECVSR
jgi:hypothetical protein